MNNLFQKRLIEVRNAFNESGYAFAKKLNIPQPTYLRYETGEQKPSGKLIELLVTFCNVNAHWLFTGEGEMFMKPDENTGERQNDTTVQDRLKLFGHRLAELQEKHGFLDREMAELLKISEKQYMYLKVGKDKPAIEVLNRLKQSFKINVDYYLYG